MRSDGECGGNNDREPGLGGDIAVTVFPANLMDFTDDLLAHIFRSLAVQHDTLALEHDSLALFVGVTLVSRRVRSLIRHRLHAEYQAALHALACLVPETRIPCGALSVLPVPSPANWEETWNIFIDNMVLTPNGLEVGGIFNYHSMYFTESLEMEVADDAQREFLLLVQTDWYDEDIYVPALVPGEGICDVTGLPNNLRSSMGEGGPTSWGVGAVDSGSVNALLAAALTRVMRAAVTIPAIASASVLHSVNVGGSVIGVVRAL